ncbi:hypothetical protein TNCV_2607731 [Trichonephila clavipes]|uniref:Uncharacterized protein n=1 Tax=Trichonephila clavipes TaxID=2585209 RepID=A0A8X6RV13_TRICX|nr:hypothetical protein TNCV_2607731 [Trichonephila clavipes]
MAQHKPRKSSNIQYTTDEEDMIIYDVENDIESNPVDKFAMKECYRNNPETYLHAFTCRNCGGGDRGRVAIYRPFRELRRAKIVLSPVWCSSPTTGVPLAHATMNFVGLDLTTSDRWH